MDSAKTARALFDGPRQLTVRVNGVNGGHGRVEAISMDPSLYCDNYDPTRIPTPAAAPRRPAWSYAHGRADWNTRSSVERMGLLGEPADLRGDDERRRARSRPSSGPVGADDHGDRRGNG